MDENEVGVFLIRNSSHFPGDLVLSVAENGHQPQKIRIKHYIIFRIHNKGRINFKIGDRTFEELSDLLIFYSTNPLDYDCLSRPVKKLDHLEKVKAIFSFKAIEKDDLSFEKGEVLDIIAKVDEGWWAARNSQGDLGYIPAPYVSPIALTSEMLLD